MEVFAWPANLAVDALISSSWCAIESSNGKTWRCTPRLHLDILNVLWLNVKAKAPAAHVLVLGQECC